MPRKNTPTERDDLMERTRAARAFVNGVPRSAASAEELELRAFMSIFHPDISTDRVNDLARDMRDQKRWRR